MSTRVIPAPLAGAERVPSHPRSFALGGAAGTCSGTPAAACLPQAAWGCLCPSPRWMRVKTHMCARWVFSRAEALLWLLSVSLSLPCGRSLGATRRWSRTPSRALLAVAARDVPGLILCATCPVAGTTYLLGSR